MTKQYGWAQKIIGESPAPVVIEIGAHVGNDTLLLHRMSDKWKRHVAVEADPENYADLQIRLLGLDITPVFAAVASANGSLQFHRCEGNQRASGSIRQPKEHLKYFPDIKFETKVEVTALTLDTLAVITDCGEETIDIIWADIQGAERDMVEGGAKTLARTRWLMAECDRVEMYEGQATRDELLAMLPSWEVVDEWPEDANLLLRNTKL